MFPRACRTSLALLGRPLFREEIQAWAHGPVVPSVWQRFRDHGWETQKARVHGFRAGPAFFLVFLDRNHDLLN